MDSRAQDILDQVDALSEAEKRWRIPQQNYEALENCSLQLEELFESRYERLVLSHDSITEFLRNDPYFAYSFQNEVEFLHISLWVIDHFHVGVQGFQHVFWNLAGKVLLFGADSSLVEHFFDPFTNKFSPDLDPLPPMLFHYIDSVGNLYSSNDRFDRSNPISAQWNFYSGLKSSRADQRDRFRTLYRRLEQSGFWDDEDEEESEFEWDEENLKCWDDPENESILASLEEVKSSAGRPIQSTQDDGRALMYAKVLMTRYFGSDRGKIPSRRSCIQQVAQFLKVPEHTWPAFHKRLDRKLKRKMALRNLGQ